MFIETDGLSSSRERGHPEFLDEREEYLLAISRLEDDSDVILGADEAWRRLGLDT